MKKLTFFLLLPAFAAGLAAQKPRLVVPVGHTNFIVSVAFSPDRKHVLTGSEDGTAKLWDLSGRELQTFAGHAGWVNSVAFSPDGKQVLTGSSDRTAKLWDLSGGEPRTFAGHADIVTSVAFSPDGKHVLTGSGDKTAKLWELKSQESKTFAGHAGRVTSVAFSPDGTHVLTGSWDKTAKLWDLEYPELKPTTFAGHETSVLSVAFSRNEKQVLTGSGDGTVMLWNLEGQELKRFNGHAGGVTSVAFSPDGTQALMGSRQGETAKLWDLSGEEPQASFAGHGDRVISVAFSPDGKQVWTGSSDGTAKLWDFSGREVQTFAGHASRISSVAFHPDGRQVLTGSGDGTAKLWDFSGKELQAFAGHAGWVSSVAFSPKGKHILVGSNDFYSETGTVRLWDLSGGEPQAFVGHEASVWSVAFSPNGDTVLTGSGDWESETGTAILWDLSGKELQAFTDHESSGVRSVAFSPDGKQVLTGSGDWGSGTAMLWDLSGREPQAFPGHESYVTSVAFSPDGKQILTGSNDGTAKLWDLSGKEPRSTFTGHTSFVESVAFSPKEKQVLTGSRDKTAKLWDLSGNELRTFAGHNGEVMSVAFSPDGKQVLTGSWDNTAKLWDAASGQELATLIAIDSTDWVVISPSGLFDASPGAMRLMHFVVGLEVIELEQLKNRYYEPGLLAKIMGLDPGGLRPVTGLGEVPLYPAITHAEIRGDLLSVQLEVRSGGIGNVALLLDGNIELDPNVNPQGATNFEVSLDRFAAYFIPDAVNRLSLRTRNREGWLPSAPYEIEYRPEGVRSKGGDSDMVSLNDETDKDLENIRMFALVVGTSKYAGEKLSLKYPDQDAAAFAEALGATGKQLFGANVEITLLTTEKPPFPRKAEIAGALEKIAAKARPNDILLVYLSGHGITYPPSSEKGRFYYLTRDIQNDKFDDSAILNTQAVAQDSLQSWIRKVPARKRILILDACNSGTVVETFDVRQKALNSDQRRALEIIKDRSGMFVLAGSAADKSSYEASRYGHGLLTYSLLNNMPLVAAANRKLVNIGQLFDNAVEEVPRLAENIGRVQKPAKIGNADYAIGMIDGPPPYKIPQAIPVFLSSGFSHTGAGMDSQELGRAVNSYLESLASSKNPVLAFWDVKDFAGDFYYIGGDYSVAGEKIEGKALVYRRKKEKLTEIPFEGGAEEVNEIAKRVVDEALAFLRNLPKQ